MYTRIKILYGLLTPLAMVLALVIFATALNHLDKGRETENLEQLKSALRRSCVACYAAEGVYPPNLEYLQKYYGLQINENYTVYYTVIADNLMPDITVLENKK